MSEIIKVRSALTEKEKLEVWIDSMAYQGWLLHDFKYVFLGSMIYFRFMNDDAQVLRSCIYDLKWDDDEEIFRQQGWDMLCRCGNTIVFYHKGTHLELPLLDMKLFTGRRMYKMSFNFMYVLALLYCLRIKNQDKRLLYLFSSTMLLLAMPLLYGVKSTRKGNQLFRFSKNIMYAILVSIIVCVLIEIIVRAFYMLF